MFNRGTPLDGVLLLFCYPLLEYKTGAKSYLTVDLMLNMSDWLGSSLDKTLILRTGRSYTRAGDSLCRGSISDLLLRMSLMRSD